MPTSCSAFYTDPDSSSTELSSSELFSSSLSELESDELEEPSLELPLELDDFSLELTLMI